MRRPTKYTMSARLYDVISFEWPVYRAGRESAFELLNLPAGSHVLDLGCGTGLNFAGLQRMIGPTGSITGVDASSQMLEQARRRADRAGWDNVTLVAADATALTSADLGEAEFDAALSTYALSLMTPWQAALDSMIAHTREGGAVAVVDMQRPVGRAAVWTPLAKLACRLGGSDIEAHPWTTMTPRLHDLSTRSVRGGHIQVRVGTVVSRPAAPSS
ncbi:MULTISPECIES: class I SAM-dependent methyltransferase [Rhodococcus]|jgi:S-adenosylmethionine-diacylgycerolhomoserine-N-methlytransferase|uniref:Class I SAM-dependent methyltransferase n=1 Tax=Rhodococcus cercidiphylli TaxID=489916 RepID=A0ABU4B1R8_9NOCA|nr:MULTISPECIES: class I SAM-dependent methyltransferase [Rhodococcus]MDV6232438.1 class I SAM-dependent methyltransferase [Rhodococcus cercidiphylli]MDV8055539.1 class I SAM-dependent methyltransferase [Rhodococcus sp. IEGM 1343]